MPPGETAPAHDPHEQVTLVGATTTILGGPIGPVHEAEQVLIPFTRHNDVVVVPGDEARQLVSRLEQAGIDGHRISFLRIGELSARAAGTTPAPGLDVGPIGQHEERSVVASALLWGIAGAIVAGLLVLAVASATPALWATVGGFVLAGAIGALRSGFRRLGASDAWERSLHMESGERAVIGVHLDEPDGNDGVTSILSPFGVWVFAADGSVVRRPADHGGGEARRSR
jgi:hypothetical protein